MTEQTEWRAEPETEEGLRGFWRVEDGPIVLAERLTEEQAHIIANAPARDRLCEELADALELADKALDNALRSAGTSVAGFIATRKLMAKAQAAGRAALKAAGRAPG